MEGTKHQNFQMNISVSSSQTESRDLVGQPGRKTEEKNFVANLMLPQIANAGTTMYNFNFTSKGISDIILS